MNSHNTRITNTHRYIAQRNARVQTESEEDIKMQLKTNGTTDYNARHNPTRAQREFDALRRELRALVAEEEQTLETNNPATGHCIPVTRECVYCAGSIVECRIAVPVNGLYVVQQCTTCGRTYPEFTR